MKKYFLYLSNHQAKLFQTGFIQQQLICDVKLSITNTDDLKAQLKTIFNSIPPFTGCHILLDLQEEEIAFTPFPKVLPWEQKDTLRIKLKQIIDTSTSISWLTDFIPSKEKNTNEKLLRIFNLNKTHLTETLIQIIEKSQQPIWGIYSSTRVLENALRTKVPKTPQVLLLETENDLRLYVFINRYIYLYRQLELYAIQSDDTLAQEINLTLRYFYNERILPYNTPFTFSLSWTTKTPVITESILHNALQQLSKNFSWINEENNIISEATPFCKHVSLSQLNDWPACITKLARKKTNKSYLTPHTKLTHILRISRHVLAILSIITLITGLGTGAWLIAQEHAHQKLLKQVNHQIHVINKYYTHLKQQLAPQMVVDYNLNQVIALATKTKQLTEDINQSELMPFIKQIGTLLENYPEFKVLELTIERESLQTKSKQQPHIIPLHAAVKINIRIIKPKLTYQENIHLIQQYIDGLNTMPNIQNAKAITLPIDITGKQTQAVHPDMLLPDTLDFTVGFHYSWKRPTKNNG